MNDADLIADRRRLRRKLGFWRALAFLGLIGAVLLAGLASSGRDALPGQTHIAKLAIKGLIAGDQRTLDLIKDVGDSRATAGVLVMIDSPGGTTAGSEAIYDSLRRLAEKKPTVAVVGTMAASGAYIAALACDRIVAQQTALVGSIGVLVQYPNFVKLLDTIGVKVEEVKSSPLKAAPNGFEPTSPEARAALASLVGDTYDWFKGLVRERRHFGDAELAAVADGRVFTGRQGLGLKLVDQIGGERDAVAWLERERGVAKDLPVREWKSRSEGTRFGLWSSLAIAASALGFEAAASTLRRAALEADVGQLDGLLAVWHPSLEK